MDGEKDHYLLEVPKKTYQFSRARKLKGQRLNGDIKGQKSAKKVEEKMYLSSKQNAL